MNSNSRMQRRRRLPRAIAYSSDEFSHLAGRTQRYPAAVACECVTIRRQSGDFHLQPLDRGIHVAHGTPHRALLSHDMPWLERLSQFQLHTHRCEFTVPRKPELEVWRKPLRIERIACGPLLGNDVIEVLLDEVRQHEAVMQLGTPASQPLGPIGRAPE